MPHAKKRADAPHRAEWGTIYAVYLALHKGHRLAPDVWTVTECNRVLSAATAAKAKSWRVIGITPEALERLTSFGFKYRSGEGFTRAHLRSRVGTVRKVLLPKRPLSLRQLADVWQKSDKTVICDRGRNKRKVPPYFRISNLKGELFSCHKKLAGWHHKKAEQDYLRELWAKRKQVRPVGTS